ncbi:hypothetical protein ACP4OV_020324 [Aristida adscensionis]
MPRTMSVTMWLTLLCLAAGLLQPRAQVDSSGFISVDCGLPGTASYVDDTTKLTYIPDAAFTDAGSNHNISAEYVSSSLRTLYLNVRSFPDGARSCYTLRPLVAGLKYTIRAIFRYGNYDGLRRPPVFDLYVGLDFWTTVNITDADVLVLPEAVVVVPDDSLHVCLVNTGSGTPFITGLELRPLKSTLYPQVKPTQGLFLLRRWNFGPTDATDIIRYPDDPHDRIWFPWVDTGRYNSISTTNRVQNTKSFEAPSKVLQTAVTPRNTSGTLDFFLARDPSTPGFIVNMHFCELQALPSNALRQFYIYSNGELFYREAITPEYLNSDVVYDSNPARFARYDISLNATANSTLPPIINALEVFTVIPTTNVGTDSQDVSAIMAIKTKYRVKKNWMGDPCVPKTFVWDGLTCSYAISSPPRITGVNVSFSGLNGDISSSFSNLKAVQYLDLSHNNLSGSIPDALSQLPSLAVLDLSDNKLSGSIPSGLLDRHRDSSLNLRYGNNPNLCTNPDTCPTVKTKNKLAVYISVPVVLVLVIVSGVMLVLWWLRLKRQGSMRNSVKPQNETLMSHVSAGAAYAQSSLQLENRRFTYKELETITNNFERELGRGGFGIVYDGFLENGTQVAVKLRSDSSKQGVKEFVQEAQALIQTHHKNLVSMIGYCKDGKYMALVYEYMSEGTLQQHIAGRNGRFLTWRQRLRIALDSAQGLEYLHKGCNPPLIHRDVKASNILLNSRLEAKIADFGLSKPFSCDDTHTFTKTLAGTRGYMDPEYDAIGRLTTKSDVYSFGVVLLELVTGRPPILEDPEPINIIDWARQRLARGNIEGVVDPRMRGDHDVNGVWKAADIALKCTAQPSAQRPAMTDVAAQLQECLELEEGRTGGGESGDARGGFFYTGGSSGVNQNSAAFEMEQNVRGVTMDTSPVVR